jgi:hypothetical protein
MREPDEPVTAPLSAPASGKLGEKPVKPATRASLREARLKQALRANMARRKAQIRARDPAAGPNKKGE